MLQTRTFLSGLIALIVLFAAQSEAAPVVLDYAGTATSASGVFAGQGLLVSGTIHFDENIVDTGAPGNPNRDEFRLNASANQAFDMFMTVDLGNASWTTEDNANPHLTLKSIERFDGPTADIWFFEIPPDSIFTGDSEARIELRSDGLSDALLFGSGGLTDQVLIPMPENFDSATGFFVARDATSTVLGSVFFSVEEITVPTGATSFRVGS